LRAHQLNPALTHPNSLPRLQALAAGVAELVDAVALGASVRKDVQVRVLSPVPEFSTHNQPQVSVSSIDLEPEDSAVALASAGRLPVFQT
jgi:hypothetical protein